MRRSGYMLIETESVMGLNWGNYPRSFNTTLLAYEPGKPLPSEGLLLPYGRGRSYGDVCLNDNASLLSTRYLDHFLHFDRDKGVLRVQAGVTLAEILRVIIPAGWFLPVLPGTKQVTVGGAIANDIHGKNHHIKGTFGCWVKRLLLLRSDRGEIECSPTHESALWQATIGGIGLTGLIVWADIQLVPLTSAELVVRSLPVANLVEFYQAIDEAVNEYEYTVAWIDCQAKGQHLGRGILFCANHAESDGRTHQNFNPEARVNVPFYAPGWLLNRYSMRAFNACYFRLHQKTQTRKVALDPFFFPLDAIGEWNSLYGKQGFLQYQAVVPVSDRLEVMREILTVVSQSGQGAFLSVLKTFGEIPSPGLLSFPLAGVTVALDFPYRGERTLQLLESLDRLVLAAGGRLYTAKDARMSKTFFQQSYPAWQQLEQLRDPLCQSNFWRRLTASSTKC